MENAIIGYRIFLQDEKNAPNGNNATDSYRIRPAVVEWSEGSQAPSLEEQVNSAYYGLKVRKNVHVVDGRYIILDENLVPARVAENEKDVPAGIYDLARQKAKEYANQRSIADNVPYVFIDVTSRANIEESERLSKSGVKKEAGMKSTLDELLQV